MADYKGFDVKTNYLLILSRIRELFESLATAHDGTIDQNYPTKAKRYNSQNNKWENWDGSAWSKLGFHTTIDDHIANTLIHAPFPPGAIVPYAGNAATPPTGWLYCLGQAESRTTYAALFNVISTIYGSGNGSSTFNVPDLRGRIPFGKALAGTGSVIGQIFGAIDHSHIIAPHQHDIPSHVHGMTHGHTSPAHRHITPNHNHFVYGHGHSAEDAGASIYINGGGQHLHRVEGQGNSAPGNIDRALRASSAGGANNELYTVNDTLSAHGHDHSTVKGTVGKWAGGQNGDVGFYTDTSGAGFSEYEVASINNFSGNTAGSGTLTTTTQGEITSTHNNPPCLTLNFLIKT